MLAETDAILLAEIAERRGGPRASSPARTSSRCWSPLASRTAPRWSDRELRDQLMTLLMAGHETTATALAWAFDLLFRAPAKLQRLRDEVDDGGQDYLDAVIEETLRMRPVVPFVGRQLRVASRAGGLRLPAGTVVMPAIYLAHTRSDLYAEPVRVPARALPGGRRPRPTAGSRSAAAPAGASARRSPQLEMRVVLRDDPPACGSAAGHGTAPSESVRRNVTLSPRDGHSGDPGRPPLGKSRPRGHANPGWLGRAACGDEGRPAGAERSNKHVCRAKCSPRRSLPTCPRSSAPPAVRTAPAGE